MFPPRARFSEKVDEVRVALIDRFRDRLPVSDSTPIVSLGEGSTPLLRAARLSERLGVDLWLKWEGVNPTGSFKDRAMTVAVSKALEEGARTIICASTGNTGASAAAYAARAGLRATVLVPQGAIAGAKLAQARALGARVLEVRGSFDEALGAARELGRRGEFVLVNSLNPYRIEGQKTAVFEIVDDLGCPPEAFLIPYGGGGNSVAYARGLRELGLDTPLYSIETADRAHTLASAIRIADPVHRPTVEASGAHVHAVDDAGITEAWLELAREEGLFCEPASAAGLAFLRRSDELRGCRVVVTVTGHGLKDPDATDRHAPPPAQVEADVDAIAEAAG
jgi:threonine synthase